MARLPDPPDELFHKINASIGFDQRLWPQDIRGSKAHVGALQRAGVLSGDEAGSLLKGLDDVAAELADGKFEFLPTDEDIHMAVERRLTALIGPVGGKLHTGRSRNDQVATDVVLYVRDHAIAAREMIAGLASVLVGLAESHREFTLPGYTHLQRAQPVYLSHHLLAYVWMLTRDAERFRAAERGAALMPLGSGALAGLNWDIDREGTAAELGFDGPMANSLDAVSSRDAVLDYLSAASICATHLSRLGGELVIWCSQEFGFAEPADNFSSGSSIMPQKKNPDAAELLRAKSPRIVASLTTLLGVLHALPLAYAKDLQEDKEALFDAVDNLEVSLQAATAMLSGITFNQERMAAAAGDEFPAATDVADMLVRKGMPFREAHGIVGSLVRIAIEEGIGLSEIDSARLAGLSELLDDDYYEIFEPGRVLDSKVSAGGTAASRVDEQLVAAHKAVEGISR